jgi:hypothetical protein
MRNTVPRPIVLALLAITVLIMVTAAARADRDCAVPAGYYRLVDLEYAGAIEFRDRASHASRLLGALSAGDIVQSDGTRAQGGGTTWQQVRVAQSLGWIPARNLWRALPMTIGKTELPAAGWCGGHQPPWSMSWNGTRLRLSLFPGRIDTDMERVRSGAGPGETLLAGDTDGLSYRIVHSNDVCRSENGEMRGLGRAYLIVTRNGEDELFSGCCSVLPASFPSRKVPGQNQ